MTTYQKLRDIVHTANMPKVALNGSVDIDVEFLNEVCVMVEELKHGIELIQSLRRPRAISFGIESYITTRAVDHADSISEKYWPEEKK